MPCTVVRQVTFLLTFPIKINNIHSIEWSDHRSADNKYCTSRIFIERADRPSIALVACAFLLECFPLHACRLPLQWWAPLHFLSLVRIHPWRAQLHICPQALHWGLRSCLIPPLCPGMHLHLLLPPFHGLHMQGHPLKRCSGLKSCQEMCLHMCISPPGAP